MNTFTCTTNNSNWMDSLENAYIAICSPSGSRITIDKVKMIRFTKEEKQLVFKCIDNELVREVALEVELTREEMSTLLRLSKI